MSFHSGVVFLQHIITRPSKHLLLRASCTCFKTGNIRESHRKHVEYCTQASAVPSPEVKPFTAIPGPTCLPLIGSMYTIVGSLREKNSNDLMAKYNQKYGPIVRQQFGPSPKDSIVSIMDRDALEILHRHDGKYPKRMIIEAWQNWREESGYSRGILIQDDGPDWKKMRVQLDKQMLQSKKVSSYEDDFTTVSIDFIERIRKIRDSGNQSIQKLDLELFNWSLESIGTVLYETRFGGLSDESRDPEMQEFIHAVHEMFRTTAYVFYMPRKINKIVIPKIQKQHDNAWAIIFKHGIKQIDKRFLEIKQTLEEGKKVTGFLSTLLMNDNMTLDKIYGNVSELMAAAVDTTSNTMLWVIYELSRQPHIQETLRDEILSFSSRGSPPSHEQFQKMKYLKSFIKEILRLYPVANADTRITTEDFVLCGYHIPTGTRAIGVPYILGRNPEYYPDPLELKPERWFRKSGEQNVMSFAWAPFGFGTRMCIGRRVAELELYILTSLMLQEFIIKSVDNAVIEPITAPLVVPGKPVRAQFLDR